MKIAPPLFDYQPELFPSIEGGVDPTTPLCGVGSHRALGGAIMERVIRDTMGWQRVAQGGHFDICFDAYSDGTYIEIKSVRQSQRMILFQSRLEHDHYASASHPVVYAVGIHRRAITNPATREQMWNDITTTLTTVVILPLSRIQQLVIDRPLCRIDKPDGGRNGFRRRGYCRGYYEVGSAELLEGTVEAGQVSGLVAGFPVGYTLRRYHDPEPQ